MSYWAVPSCGGVNDTGRVILIFESLDKTQNVIIEVKAIE